MSSDSSHGLRAIFDEVPELYDRARPGYPSEVFDDLAVLAGLPESARILEIGCGTGKATAELAARGFRITCIELGAQLAALAQRKLPAVAVIHADFETWRPSAAAFDAVVAFTAFHWIDPSVRYEKAASLLHAGGVLAVVATEHVLPSDGDEFFVDVQEDYVAVVADEKAQAGGPSGPEAVGDLSGEIETSGFFDNVAVRRYLWDVTYTSEEYISVLDTYSGHRALDAATRELLYERIRGRIERRPDGTVRKTYLATLNVARSRLAAAG